MDIILAAPSVRAKQPIILPIAVVFRRLLVDCNHSNSYPTNLGANLY
jgi:hypothetical protein